MSGIDKPWYVEHGAALDQAGIALSRLLMDLSKDVIVQNEMKSFFELQQMRSIYESNLIEVAGLKSKGETKRIIEENFPKIDNSFAFYRDCHVNKKQGLSQIFDLEKVRKAYEEIQTKGLPIVPTAKFGNKTKQIYEVTKHYIAFKTMQIHSMQWRYARDVADRPTRSQPSGLSKEQVDFIEIARGYKEDLFSQVKIKEMHGELMSGLIASKDGGKSGEYRKHNVTVDFDVVFPSHENVQACMDAWEMNSNKLIERVNRGEVNPIEAAAEISYDFVMIHPFPDGNGRMSRLIMNLALSSLVLPFYVDIRGGLKYRHRYMTALRHANRGKIQSLTCLIAKRIVEIIEEIYLNVGRAVPK